MGASGTSIQTASARIDRNPIWSYWVPKLLRNQERDAANRVRLGELGWDAFIVWECEVGNAVDLTDRIASFLELDDDAPTRD